VIRSAGVVIRSTGVGSAAVGRSLSGRGRDAAEVHHQTTCVSDADPVHRTGARAGTEVWRYQRPMARARLRD